MVDFSGMSTKEIMLTEGVSRREARGLKKSAQNQNYEDARLANSLCGSPYGPGGMPGGNDMMSRMMNSGGSCVPCGMSSNPMSGMNGMMNMMMQMFQMQMMFKMMGKMFGIESSGKPDKTESNTTKEKIDWSEDTSARKVDTNSGSDVANSYKKYNGDDGSTLVEGVSTVDGVTTNTTVIADADNKLTTTQEVKNDEGSTVTKYSGGAEVNNSDNIGTATISEGAKKISEKNYNKDGDITSVEYFDLKGDDRLEITSRNDNGGTTTNPYGHVQYDFIYDGNDRLLNSVVTNDGANANTYNLVIDGDYKGKYKDAEGNYYEYNTGELTEVE